MVGVESFAVERRALGQIASTSSTYGCFQAPQVPFVGRVLSVTGGESAFDVGTRVVAFGPMERLKARCVAMQPTELTAIRPNLPPFSLTNWLGTPRIAFETLLQQTKLRQDDWILQTAPLSPLGRIIIKFARQLRLRTLNLVTTEEEAVEVLNLKGDAAPICDPRSQSKVEKLVFSRGPGLALLAPNHPMSRLVAPYLPSFCHVVDPTQIPQTDWATPALLNKSLLPPRPRIDRFPYQHPAFLDGLFSLCLSSEIRFDRRNALAQFEAFKRAMSPPATSRPSVDFLVVACGDFSFTERTDRKP